MHGLDVMLGVSWGDVGDVGKAAFPYVHATGKGIASAFGAGAAADALETVEQKQGWLPPTQPASAAAVTAAAQKVATVATPAFHAAAAKATPTATATTAPTPSPIDVKPTSPTTAQPTQLSTTTLVVGVGVFGILALLLHRLWSK